MAKLGYEANSLDTYFARHDTSIPISLAHAIRSRHDQAI